MITQLVILNIALTNAILIFTNYNFWFEYCYTIVVTKLTITVLVAVAQDDMSDGISVAAETDSSSLTITSASENHQVRLVFKFEFWWAFSFSVYFHCWVVCVFIVTYPLPLKAFLVHANKPNFVYLNLISHTLTNVCQRWLYDRWGDFIYVIEASSLDLTCSGCWSPFFNFIPCYTLELLLIWLLLRHISFLARSSSRHCTRLNIHFNPAK